MRALDRAGLAPAQQRERQEQEGAAEGQVADRRAPAGRFVRQAVRVELRLVHGRHVVGVLTEELAGRVHQHRTTTRVRQLFGAVRLVPVSVEVGIGGDLHLTEVLEAAHGGNRAVVDRSGALVLQVQGLSSTASVARLDDAERHAAVPAVSGGEPAVAQVLATQVRGPPLRAEGVDPRIRGRDELEAGRAAGVEFTFLVEPLEVETQPVGVRVDRPVGHRRRGRQGEADDGQPLAHVRLQCLSGMLNIAPSRLSKNGKKSSSFICFMFGILFLLC